LQKFSVFYEIQFLTSKSMEKLSKLYILLYGHIHSKIIIFKQEKTTNTEESLVLDTLLFEQITQADYHSDSIP